MKPTSNAPCPCGSNKKYKRCCREKDRNFQNFIEEIRSGKLHPMASISSSNSAEPTSMTISNMTTTINGKQTIFLDKEVTLTTNSIEGFAAENSSASLFFPKPDGTIKTVGNASVSVVVDVVNYVVIKIVNDAKKLKAKNDSNLFVIASVKLQRNTGFNYFDILFGEQGQSEDKNEDGNKQRSHIAFYPDGNGKYIRLASHLCEIEGDLQYNSNSRLVIPQKIRIKSIKFSVIIELSFLFENDNSIILEKINFIN